MIDFAESIKEILEELRKARSRCVDNIAELPEGYLASSKYAKGRRYYQCIKEDGKVKRKGIGYDKDLVLQLARKEFLSLAVAALDSNIALLQSTDKKYQPCDRNSIMEKMPEYAADLPDEAFFEGAADLSALGLDATEQQRIQSHAEWGEQPYAPSDYKAEGRIQETSRKEYVRSKAELVIAEKLYEYGIPFRYEQELVVNGRTFHPDFTFEAANGSEFYLEFCGMMDDEAYVASHIKKRRLYEEAGIVPWKNIIFMYAAGNELSARQIVSMIENQIIPWL